MANATKYPSLTELTYFQWSRPGAARPNLARPINEDTVDASNATVFFSAAPVDDSGNVITDPFLFGIKRGDGTNEGYTMLCYAPNGADGSGGLSATGCVLGIKLKGLDFTTSDSDNVISFSEGDEIFCAIDAVMKSLGVAALQGAVATGGNEFIVGREQDEDMYFSVKNSSGVQRLFRKESSTGNAQYSDDGGSSWNNLSGALAGQLIVVTGADTTAGNLNAKVSDGDGIAKSTLNPGGNEQLNLAVDLAADSGLEFDSGQLQAKIAPGEGLKRGPNGLGLQQPSFPTVTAGENIDGSTTPQAVFISRGTTDSDAWPSQKNIEFVVGQDYDVYGVNWEAQSFTTGAYDDTITKIRLNLFKVGSPSGNLRVRLFAVDGSGHPTGSALGTVNLTASSVSSTATDELKWYDFTFASAITVSPSTQYIIVSDVISGDSSNYIQWNSDNTNPYSGGERVFSADAGSSWTSDASDDFMFEVYSYESQTAGRIYKSDKDAPHRRGVDGFVTESVTAGNTTALIDDGAVSSFSGLTAGSTYYLDSTAGGVTTSTGGLRIGRAISTTELLLELDRAYALSTDSTGVVGGSSAQNVRSVQIALNFGFYPSRVELLIMGDVGDNTNAGRRRLQFQGQLLDGLLYGNAHVHGAPDYTSNVFLEEDAYGVSSFSWQDGSSTITATIDGFALGSGGLQANIEASANTGSLRSSEFTAIAYR